MLRGHGKSSSSASFLMCLFTFPTLPIVVFDFVDFPCVVFLYMDILSLSLPSCSPPDTALTLFIPIDFLLQTGLSGHLSHPTCVPYTSFASESHSAEARNKNSVSDMLDVSSQARSVRKEIETSESMIPDEAMRRFGEEEQQRRRARSPIPDPRPAGDAVKLDRAVAEKRGRGPDPSTLVVARSKRRSHCVFSPLLLTTLLL